MRVLAIVSHPDDEVLGCGGALIRHVRSGDEVSIFILGKGIAARDIAEEEKEKVISNVVEHAREASEIIGAKELVQEDFPDNKFDSVPRLEIIKSVEKAVNELVPDIVYTHYSNDLNVDHRITCEAVITACRPIGFKKTINIFSFESLSSTEWQKIPFNPDYYVDISDCVDNKIKAMTAYTTEMREFPHPRSEEGIKSLARYRGMQSGVHYAEAFKAVRVLV